MYLRAHTEKSSLIDCPRFRHLIVRLHALGPRTIAEFIATISGCSDIMPVLERFAAIDPAEVRAVGADRWPVSIFLVGDVRSGSAGLEAILRASLASADGDDAA